MNARFIGYDSQIKALERENHSLKEQVQRAMADKQQIQLNKDNLSNLERQVERLLERDADKEKRIGTLLAADSAMQRQIQEVERSNRSLVQRIEELERSYNQRDVSDRFHKIETEQRTLSTSFSNISKDVHGVKRDVDALQTTFKADINELKAEDRNLASRIQTLTTDLGRINLRIENLKDNRVDQLGEQFTRLEVAVSGIGERFGRLESMARTNSDIISQFKQSQARVDIKIETDMGEMRGELVQKIEEVKEETGKIEQAVLEIRPKIQSVEECVSSIEKAVHVVEDKVDGDIMKPQIVTVLEDKIEKIEAEKQMMGVDHTSEIAELRNMIESKLREIDNKMKLNIKVDFDQLIQQSREREGKEFAYFREDIEKRIVNLAKRIDDQNFEGVLNIKISDVNYELGQMKADLRKAQEELSKHDGENRKQNQDFWELKSSMDTKVEEIRRVQPKLESLSQELLELKEVVKQTIVKLEIDIKDNRGRLENNLLHQLSALEQRMESRLKNLDGEMKVNIQFDLEEMISEKIKNDGAEIHSVRESIQELRRELNSILENQKHPVREIHVETVNNMERHIIDKLERNVLMARDNAVSDRIGQLDITLNRLDRRFNKLEDDSREKVVKVSPEVTVMVQNMEGLFRKDIDALQGRFDDHGRRLETFSETVSRTRQEVDIERRELQELKPKVETNRIDIANVRVSTNNLLSEYDASMREKIAQLEAEHRASEGRQGKTNHDLSKGLDELDRKNRQRFSEVDSEFHSKQTHLDRLENKLGEIQKEVKHVEETVDNIPDLSGEITALKIKSATNTTSINGNIQEINNLKLHLTQLEREQQNSIDLERVLQLEKAKQELQHQVKAVEDRSNLNTSDIDILRSKLETQNNAATVVEERFQQHSAEVENDYENRIQELERKIQGKFQETVEVKFKSHSSDIGALKEGIQNNTNEIVALKPQVRDNTRRITTLEELRRRLDYLTRDLDSLKTDIHSKVSQINISVREDKDGQEDINKKNKEDLLGLIRVVNEFKAKTSSEIKDLEQKTIHLEQKTNHLDEKSQMDINIDLTDAIQKIKDHSNQEFRDLEKTVNQKIEQIDMSWKSQNTNVQNNFDIKLVQQEREVEELKKKNREDVEKINVEIDIKLQDLKRNDLHRIEVSKQKRKVRAYKYGSYKYFGMFYSDWRRKKSSFLCVSNCSDKCTYAN